MGTTAAFILGCFVILSGKGQGPESHYYLSVYADSLSSGSEIGRKNRSNALPRLYGAIINDGYGSFGRTMLKASLAKDQKIQAEKNEAIQARITNHLNGITR